MHRFLGFWFSGVVSAAAILFASTAGGAEPAVFHRGVNLNGPPLMIDGRSWEGGDAARLRCNGAAFENQAVPLKPAVDGGRARMIRSSRWGRSIDVDLLETPAGEYQVCLYVWEDDRSETFSVSLNGRLVQKDVVSGPAGSWRRLGPWRTNVVDGTLRVSARGGDANLSGVEVWSGVGIVPPLPGTEFAAELTDDQLKFFEGRIRPLLVAHCYECHSRDSKELGGGLFLDSRPGIVQGGDTAPPIVPGDPDASLLVKAVRWKDAALQMPPTEKLADAEIADLEAWVRMRAPDPRTTVAPAPSKGAIDWDRARDFWSLRPLVSPPAPAVKNAAWPRDVLDRFILARLEAEGLEPAADAAPATLLRRASFDLIGLPPTPEEIAAFEADRSPDAFAKQVERLLASPQYGPRWGRHWLDVVRYADTAGDNSDFPIPQMHRYRDWVIDAFNADLPYDQFVREQLAGDLLPSASPQEARRRLIATGYLANSRRFGSRVDDYPWHLTIEDTLDNLGRTFLATTINCARCHNHKFDPVTTEDYYALYGVFQSTRYPWPGIELEQKQRDLRPLIPDDEAARVIAERDARRKELEARVEALKKRRDAADGEAKKELEKELEAAKKESREHAQQPLPFEQAYAVAEAAKREDAAVQKRGDPAKPGAVVRRRFLTVLGGAELPADDATSGRGRLAEWIVDPRNPLTARVMANRIWLHHFGKGLAPTPNDFGRQGRAPTHPELLDHLASEFIRSGWSIKAMHRKLLLSRTYRLGGVRSAAALAKDPGNDLLASFPRRRLDAEALRDALLQLGGSLDLSPGGPHPFPPQSEWKFTQHNPFKAVYETNRRSVYLMTQRIQRHPYLAIFDGPDPSASTARRGASTTPLQALYFLNDPLVHDQAAGLARRLLSERDADPARIERLFLLCLGRRPTEDEAAAARDHLERVEESLKIAGAPADGLPSACWQSLVRAVFRLNEFVYVD